MRIGKMGSLNNSYYSKKVKNAYNSVGTKGKDAATFSDFGKDMVEARKAVDQIPDVRTEKINDIKSKIDSGKYNISASMIADKMLAKMGW